MFKLFKQLKSQYIFNQVAKYKKNPLFQQPIDAIEFQMGVYGAGMQRDMSILLDLDTTKLIDCTLCFDENDDVVLRGTNKKNNMPFQKVIRKEDIAWHTIRHIKGITLGENFDEYVDPNEGVFDMGLKNGESIIMYYKHDKTISNIFLD